MYVAGEEDTARNARHQRKQAPLGRSRKNEPPGENEHSVYKSLQQGLEQNTGRKSTRMQNQKGRPRRPLCQRTVRGRYDPKSLGKRLTLNHGQPPIALSVTGKRYSHKEPKREPKHGSNKINVIPILCARIGIIAAAEGRNFTIGIHACWAP